MIVYLSGPIADSTDSEAGEWRNKASEGFRLYGWETIDPFKQRDYRFKRGYNPAEVVEADKADINRSDIILANCWKPSPGTSMEILYAWEKNKPVIIIHPSPRDISPWLLYHSTRVVDSLYVAMQYLVGEIWDTKRAE